MPHLIIQGVDPEQAGEIRSALIAELAILCRCSADEVSVELRADNKSEGLEKLRKLQSDNEQLRVELQKARKAMQTRQAGMKSPMSSKLYDALRE